MSRRKSTLDGPHGRSAPGAAADPIREERWRRDPGCILPPKTGIIVVILVIVVI